MQHQTSAFGDQGKSQASRPAPHERMRYTEFDLPRPRRWTLYDPNRKQLSRVVALAKYDVDHPGHEISLGGFRKLVLERARAALALYDDHHPAEALVALESDGEVWNRHRYQDRRAELLARIAAQRRRSWTTKR